MRTVLVLTATGFALFFLLMWREMVAEAADPIGYHMPWQANGHNIGRGWVEVKGRAN